MGEVAIHGRTTSGLTALFSFLLFSALLVLAWPHLFLKGQVPLDGNILRYFYPSWVFLHAHPPNLLHWPLWNPYRDMGEPFLADPQSMAAYPPMWLLCRLPNFLSFMRWWVAGHTLLAGFFMGKWVFRLTGDVAASAASAIVIALNGFFMAHGTLPNHFAAAAYLPAVLYFFDGHQTRALSAVLALQWLAGFPPFSLLTGLCLLAWSLFAGPATFKRLAKSGSAAAGLAAFHIFPFCELLRQSSRPLILNPSVAIDFSEPGRQLLRMLFIPQWFSWNPQLVGDQAVVSFYVGPFALLASGWALWKGGKRERLLGLMTFVGFLFSLGSNLPGYPHIFLMRMFRFPANWLLLSAAGIAALCGIGLSGFAHRRWRWMSAGLILADLLAFAQYVRTPWFTPEFLETPPPLAKTLLPEAARSRLYHLPFVTQDLLSEGLKGRSDYDFLKDSLTPSYGMAFGLREVVSYQVLTLARAERFQNKLIAEGPQSPLLHWAGVSTVVTRAPSPEPWGPQNIRIISVKNSDPPLFFAGHRPRQKAEIIMQEPGKILARVETDAGDKLIFSEVLYPGWKVFVDGKETPLDVFEETFLAVQISPGVHAVAFRLISLSFVYGVVLSLATILWLLCSRLRTPR